MVALVEVVVPHGVLAVMLLLGCFSPDHTSLSSICTPIPITVQTTDGSSLSVAGRGTLLSSFHVPSVSYVPNLIMQLTLNVSLDQCQGCKLGKQSFHIILVG